ncbi:MAG: hypothetical protein AAB390_03800, partial [Patescibacteria group bacterium]
DCKKVLTVDAKEFCGDGAVNGPEKCDAQGGKVFGSSYADLTCLTDKNACVAKCSSAMAYENCVNVCNQTYLQCSNPDQSVALTCLDKGAYQCSANCLVLENKCVNCGKWNGGLLSKATAGNAIPYVNIINPMLNEVKKNVAVIQELHKISLLRRNTDGAGGFTYESLNDNSGNNGSAILEFFEYFNIFKDNSFPKIGIETDLQCNGEYSVYFNYPYGAVPHIEDGDGDVFDYPVAGQAKEIKNDLIYSPAVPKNVFRVVIKWGEEESKKNGTFVGSLYNDGLATGWLTTHPDDIVGTIFNFADYAQKYQGSDFLCDWINNVNYKNEPYYWPSKNPASNSSICLSSGNPVGYNGIYVHPIATTGKTTVQAFTIDLNNHNGDFAFLVTSINNLLSTFKEDELTVEVYEFHSGQLPLYSVYAPVATFKIKDIVDDNFNDLAKYWHVFNFRKNAAGDYEIKKIPVTDAGGNYSDELGKSFGEYDNGWLNTNICQVLNQIPDVPSENKCAL